jgi:hypothetical protein
LIFLVILGKGSSYEVPHYAVSQTCLCVSLNVRDQVSHLYRTTGKIRVLYIPTVTFFNSRRVDRKFWTEW